MTSVIRRTFRSSPFRDARATWTAVVDLLTKGISGEARTELLAVVGLAASIISDRTPSQSPIVITCDGPRTRIYCLFDDDAVDGSDSDEGTLGYDPLKGDWRVSLPCPVDDLAWVQAALIKCSARITAREPNAAVVNDTDTTGSNGAALEVNLKGFLGQ